MSLNIRLPMTISKFATVALISSLMIPVAFAQTWMTEEEESSTSSQSFTYCPQLTYRIERGSRDATTGGQVSMLQRFLIERGYLDIAQPTGNAGSLTVAGIREFQADKRISPTGSTGPLTRQAIFNDCPDVSRTSGNTSSGNTGSSSNGSGTIDASQAMVQLGANSNNPPKTSIMYWNLPANTRITLVNQDTGVATKSSVLIAEGGTGAAMMAVSKDMARDVTYVPKATDKNGNPVSIWVAPGTGLKLNYFGTTSEVSFNLAALLSGMSEKQVSLAQPSIGVSRNGSVTIAYGERVRLDWVSTSAENCTLSDTASNTSTDAGLAGFKIITPTQTTTYKLQCFSGRGAVATSEFKVVVPGSGVTGSVVPATVVANVKVYWGNTWQSVSSLFSYPGLKFDEKMLIEVSGDDNPTSYKVKFDGSALTLTGDGTTGKWDPLTVTKELTGTTTFSGSAESFGLKPGNYTVYAQACNSVGCSAWVNAGRITVTAIRLGGTRVLGASAMCADLKNGLLHLEKTDAQSNGEVSLLQEFLASKGLFSGNLTGYYGRLTRDAVVEYQKAKGIEATGNVGTQTAAAIKKESCE